MKKITFSLILMLLITSCSLVKQESSKIEKVSIGKYETPNGTQYELIKFGTGFLFKKTDGKTDNKTYSSTGEIQKYLNEQNLLITSEYVDIFGKKYKISNYKGINITDDTGKKINKSFSGSLEAIKYLDDLNPPTCDVSIKNFVDKNLSSDLAYEPRNKNYLGKNRIVSFKNLSECKGGKLNLDYKDGGLDIKGASDYSYIDMLSFVGGGGPANEEPIKSESFKVNSPNGFQGDLSILEFKNGRYSISLNMSDILIQFGSIWNPKKLSKEELLKVVNEFKLIGKTFNLTSEIPVFNWNIKPNSKDYTNTVEFLGYMLSEEYESKGYKEGGILGKNNGMEKVIYPKGGNINFGDCTRSVLECEYKGYDSSSKSLIIDTYPYNYGMNLQEKNPQIRKTYYINTSNGKVRLK